MNKQEPITSDHQCNTPVQFWRAGKIQGMASPSPNLTLLDYLRSTEGPGARGTKEGCAEGDCGACTVVIAELEGDTQALKYRAINSCIRFAYQIDGCALWTVEDLSAPQATLKDAPASVLQPALHPVQQALLEAHASQCGFCTPGFVMSLFGLYQNSTGTQIQREQAIGALSGNLCRCTGYRPILDAAQAMLRLPRVEQPEDEIKSALLDLLSQRSAKPSANFDNIFRPGDLATLLLYRQQYPQAQMVAGATDVGLWVTKQGQRFETVLDLNGTKELLAINTVQGHLEIGAAVRLEDAYRAMIEQRGHLLAFAHRFAGLPVRQSGTLGGNLANGSPIGDSMPLLIALASRVRLASHARGPRDIALEDFYLGYRRTQLAPDEVLTHVLIPLPEPAELSRIYKVSKRFEDDISALCIGISISLDPDKRFIQSAQIGVGGMAATPSRAYKTELALAGQAFSLATFAVAKEIISAEFSPLDDMRAGARYRRQVAGNLMLRFWAEVNHPDMMSSLESFEAAPLPWPTQNSIGSQGLAEPSPNTSPEKA
jgi:xanthine dehydrogenase small subunit